MPMGGPGLKLVIDPVLVDVRSTRTREFDQEFLSLKGTLADSSVCHSSLMSRPRRPETPYSSISICASCVQSAAVFAWRR